MGAWGFGTFENDTAADWAYGLEDTNDLSHIEAALGRVESAGGKHIDADLASEALAACEVIAGLRARPDPAGESHEAADLWVAANKSLKPPPALLARAASVIDRILGDGSELAELWDESDDGPAWRAAVQDLRRRATS